jgi:hypothetical protein
MVIGGGQGALLCVGQDVLLQSSLTLCVVVMAVLCGKTAAVVHVFGCLADRGEYPQYP